MSKRTQAPTPRRAQSDATAVDDLELEVEVITETSRAARRRRGRTVGRGAVAAALAGAMTAMTLFGFAYASRNGETDLTSDHVATDIAIPAAAVEAIQQGFSDRTEQASRNQVRDTLTEGIAETEVGERAASLSDAADAALEISANETAEEREAAIAADQKLVEAQAAQLKKEAEEAAARLAAAQAAAEALAKANGTTTTTVSEADLAAISSKGASMPLHSNYRVGASFGARGHWSRWHTGQDFPAPVGTPIYAAASGIVLSPTRGGWAGTNVVIQHSNGGATLYAHMQKRVVSPGQAVKAGQLIGYVGLTGRTFGAHLHFEYYPKGVTPGDVYSASNPMAFLRSLGVRG